VFKNLAEKRRLNELDHVLLYGKAVQMATRQSSDAGKSFGHAPQKTLKRTVNKMKAIF
jgi:hypothetical protein